MLVFCVGLLLVSSDQTPAELSDILLHMHPDAESDRIITRYSFLTDHRLGGCVGDVTMMYGHSGVFKWPWLLHSCVGSRPNEAANHWRHARPSHRRNRRTRQQTAGESRSNERRRFIRRYGDTCTERTAASTRLVGFVMREQA